jgi:hypothetical protein
MALASVNGRLAVVGGNHYTGTQISNWMHSGSKRRTSMTVMLNRRAFEDAKEVINEGRSLRRLQKYPPLWRALCGKPRGPIPAL